jgi:hypothetical protein
MSVADHIHLDSSKFRSAGYDRLVMLSYAFFAVVFLALIYVDSTSSGTAAGDFASMSAFP